LAPRGIAARARPPARFAADQLPEIRPDTGPASSDPFIAPVRAAVDALSEVASLPFKTDVAPGDPRLRAILGAGAAADPLLVAKITDMTPTRVVQGFHYKVSDLAILILTRRHAPRFWPFPDGSVALPRHFDDFRDYAAFMETPGARDRLRLSWSRYLGLTAA
jgi:hypothetical protein